MTSSKKTSSNKEPDISFADYSSRKGISLEEIRLLVSAGVLRIGSTKNTVMGKESVRSHKKLKKNIRAHTLLTTADACEMLGVGIDVFERVVAGSSYDDEWDGRGKRYSPVNPARIVSNKDGSKTMYWSLLSMEGIQNDRARVPEMKKQAKAEKEKNKAFEIINENVTISERKRDESPESTTIYYGPTNSGKTYRAVHDIIDAYRSNPEGHYTYAGPLRMLAFEFYNKLREELGDEAVGFITGEEQINEDAHVVCCTVEMAPMSGDLIVIDEAHWLADEDRGQYWTDLLVSAVYSSFVVITAKEALSTVTRLLSDSHHMKAVELHRLSPVRYEKDSVAISQLKKRTAVIAFSRKAVYCIARLINNAGKLRAGVVYGALPISCREEQIRRFEKGEYDVMVTTDVIGHGINLPIDHLVFAETNKFDGHKRRTLYSWEASQIAGRAGRYGITDTGTVKCLYVPSDYSFDCSTPIVMEAAKIADGSASSDLAIENVIITPQLEDINPEDPSYIFDSMSAWQNKTNIKSHETKIMASELSEVRHLLSVIASYSSSPLHPWRNGTWNMDSKKVWKLATSPLDPDSDVLQYIIKWVNGGCDSKSTILQRYYARSKDGAERITTQKNIDAECISLLERHYKNMEQLTLVDTIFGGLGTLGIDEVNELRERISECINKGIDAAIRLSKYGVCCSCGKPCAPWFDECDSCHSRGWRSCYDDFRDDEEWRESLI